MKVENTAVDGRDDVPRPDSAEDRQSVDIDVKSESDETATVSSNSWRRICFGWGRDMKNKWFDYCSGSIFVLIELCFQDDSGSMTAAV